MTAEDPERDERELRGLFDRTAETLDGPGLTKLRARSLDVPSAGRRRRWWLVFAPVMAVAAGALLMVLFRPGSGSQPIARGTESAIQTPRAPSPEPSALALQSSRPATPSASESAEPTGDDNDLESSELVADLPAADDESSGNDLFAALDEPADEDVDAWLAATGAFLEGG